MIQPDEGLTRRSFLHAGAGTVAGVALGGEPHLARRQSPPTPRSFPRQDPSLVERVVLFSHFDLDAVRELVGERPELAQASWDWGFGDWESPVGAASHVGRRDIVEFLLRHGARPNLFTFAMLGELEAVRSMIEARPGVQRIPGPHGLSLLHHARAGGDAAREVAAYLEERGDADPRPTEQPLDGEEIAGYLGDYRLEGGAEGAFQIVERDGRIGFRAVDSAPRDLLHQGGAVFHPVGAPGVRLRFELRDGRARRVTIEAGGSRWSGERVSE